MKVALTGATGFIGSHILTELRGHGHEVTALVRNDGHGVTPSVVDLYDRSSLAKVLGDADGAIHIARPGDAAGAVPGSDAEAHGRLGDSFAEVLLLDQGTKADRARSELGWRPLRPTLVEEFRGGSYRT